MVYFSQLIGAASAVGAFILLVFAAVMMFTSPEAGLIILALSVWMGSRAWRWAKRTPLIPGGTVDLPDRVPERRSYADELITQMRRNQTKPDSDLWEDE